MILRAYAKVNLTLEVLGKRPDGYHEIRSIMRTLALHDTIRLAPAPSIDVACTVPSLSGPENLAHRAAKILKEGTGYQGGARIEIEKEIPTAAGLGGGSSDAATTLLGLNELWQTGLSRRDLALLATQLGSDVPFFLYGGTALATGRGEQVRPLADLPNCTVLLVHPPVEVSTALIYGAVTPDAYSDGTLSERLAALPTDTPPGAWPLTNALQAITTRAFPVVAEILNAMVGWGALQRCMCGSGPTCFALFEQEHSARQAAEEAASRGWRAEVTTFS